MTEVVFMNKNFLKATSLTLGLTLASLPLVGCNMGGGTARRNQPEATGQNTQQNNQSVNPNRFLNMDLNPMDNKGANNNNGMNNNAKSGLLGRIDTTPMGNPAAPAAPTPGVQSPEEMKQKSENITNQLDAMPEIDKVNALVTGNTCLVGYSPANAQGDPNARKNMVIEKVKQIDPNVNNVVASESQDVMNRISQLLNDIANNRPMDEINREVMQLMKTTAPNIS